MACFYAAKSAFMMYPLQCWFFMVPYSIKWAGCGYYWGYFFIYRALKWMKCSNIGYSSVSIYGSIAWRLYASPPEHFKKKVVHFQHFLAEKPSQGCIFYEKLVWPPKILTAWSIFFAIPKKCQKPCKIDSK